MATRKYIISRHVFFDEKEFPYIALSLQTVYSFSRINAFSSYGTAAALFHSHLVHCFFAHPCSHTSSVPLSGQVTSPIFSSSSSDAHIVQSSHLNGVNDNVGDIFDQSLHSTSTACDFSNQADNVFDPSVHTSICFNEQAKGTSSDYFGTRYWHFNCSKL